MSSFGEANVSESRTHYKIKEWKNGSLVNTCVCLKQNTLASNKTADLADLTDLFIPIMTDLQISAFLAKAHPDGCKSRARL